MVVVGGLAAVVVVAGAAEAMMVTMASHVIHGLVEQTMDLGSGLALALVPLALPCLEAMEGISGAITGVISTTVATPETVIMATTQVAVVTLQEALVVREGDDSLHHILCSRRINNSLYHVIQKLKCAVNFPLQLKSDTPI